jgi:succinate dehydrogenase / fumarate reductase flavoprotein subunit
MSESLRNDGRVWVPKNPEDTRRPNQIPEEDRRYFLEEKYPSFGNLVPRDVASRNAKEMCDAGLGVGATGYAVYLDFADAINRDGKDVIQRKYGNLFDMYQNITDDNPYETPMMIYPASHYTMGGLWVDYELQTTVPGLFAAGEANFSDHGANRLGASALMQGLSDGYFVLPYTIAPYLADLLNKPVPDTSHPEFAKIQQEAADRFKQYMSIGGTKTPDHFHRELGKIIWDYCGMDRNATGLEKAISEIPALHEEFKKDLRVTGSDTSLNQTLEKAGRVDDFFELGMLMCKDALNREESCGGHFRSEHQTEDGEAVRNDDDFAYVSAWEWSGDMANPIEHKEQLEYEVVKFQTRSYK